MAEIVVKDILDAGVHYGHRSSRWNPKMRPYIYGRRNQIHIIDIKETIRGLIRAKKYLLKVAAQGGLVLFVGTKRQASASIEELAQECKMPYCTERWLGGTLTNFRTIRTRLKRLEELENLRETGEIRNYSKKMQSTLTREYTKIYRNLNGMREMSCVKFEELNLQTHQGFNERCVKGCIADDPSMALLVSNIKVIDN